MRYRLRTLLIVLALGPLVLAGVWWGWQQYLVWSMPGEEMRLTRELYRQFYGPNVKPPTKPLPLGPKD